MFEPDDFGKYQGESFKKCPICHGPTVLMREFTGQAVRWPYLDALYPMIFSCPHCRTSEPLMYRPEGNPRSVSFAVAKIPNIRAMKFPLDKLPELDIERHDLRIFDFVYHPKWIPTLPPDFWHR